MRKQLMTVRETAEIWGISVRRVQELCRQGRVQGAVLFGKSWMIPSDTRRPADGRGNSCSEEVKPLPRRTPVLYMTNLYHSPGCAAQALAGLQSHPEAQTLFEAGIAYCRGEIDRACALLLPFLGRTSGFYAMTGAGLILSFCAIWRGDGELWDRVMHYIARIPVRNEAEREQLSLVYTVVNGGLMEFRGYPDWFDRGDFSRLPPDSHPAARVFSARYLHAVAYSIASRQITYQGIEGLGMMGVIPYSIELMINEAVVEKTVISEIHLRLWCATAYHNVGKDEFAIPHIDRAIALALPDGLLGILAEHSRSMDSLLENRLALIDPSLVRTVRSLHRIYFENQSVLRRRVANRMVAVNLTTREREIAKMAAFGMTNRTIAKNLGIGESTVKSTIQNVMLKTGITDRADFVLIL